MTMFLMHRIPGLLIILTSFANQFDQTASFSMSMMANTSHNTNTNTNAKRRKNKRKPNGSTNTNNQKPKPNHNQQKIKQSQKKQYTLEQLTDMTVAQAIQESVSSKQLLHTANRMWLPADENLPPHLRTQKIHHDKRIKAAGQLVHKLGECVGRENGVKFYPALWTGAKENGLKRAILASSIPFQKGNGDIGSGSSSDSGSDSDSGSGTIDGRSICITLAGVHSIVGFTLPHSSSQGIIIDAEILQAFKNLILEADGLAWKLPMYEAVEVRWAIRGILSRLGPFLFEMFQEDNRDSGNRNGNGNGNKNGSSNGNDSGRTRGIESAKEIIPNLEERIANLPFDIIPSCLDWDSFEADNDAMTSLLSDIPFNLDTITTRDGSKVEERRGTAWIADEGIGSLAYSGKLMNPHPLPSIVSKAMRQVEESIIASEKHEQLELCCDTMGKYFDCALCNHYPNEESACKFHTDPEHGIYWERLTCVVSAGNDDVRKFAFRPIPNENEWDRFETNKARKGGIQNQKDDGILPAVVPLFPGDVVKMDHDCNDMFHHAVYGRPDISTSADIDLVNFDGRVSLVFKRAMDRGNGRKGHGKAGQGRRAKRY